MASATDFTLAGIRWYQRRISPHKGFRCAHAAYFGGPSCSNAVMEIVRVHGLVAGWPHIVARFAQCRLAYSELRAEGRVFQHLGTGSAEARVQGLCCCGPVPIPFRCG